MKTEIKNLKKVAKRILKAIKSKERIILFGDTDLDGACSVIILEESIKNLGGEVSEIYFPDREKEGYGINEKALYYLKKTVPALLISLDCGIGNFKEVNLAKKIGFEVIIIDHHVILNKIPNASIVVDPKQKGDKYPFKDLSNTGIVYKLSQILLKEKLKGFLEKNFLELVALATLADMMPQVGENKILIAEGLDSLDKTLRPALKVLLKTDSIRGEVHNKMLASKIISVLNIAGSRNHLTESYLFLNSPDEKTAKILAKNLIEKSKEKYLKIREITEEVEQIALENLNSPIIFEGDKDWPLMFLGSVASRICRDFQKPAFLFKKGKIKSKGSVRTPKGLNSVEAMKSCSELLETFGGHPPASGFTVKNENLEKFEQCLVDYFTKRK